MQFSAKPKLGGDQLIATFQHKVDSDIEEKFKSFKQDNDKKRANFVGQASLHNEKVSNEIRNTFEKIQLAEFESKTNLRNFDPHSIYELARKTALYEVKLDENL